MSWERIWAMMLRYIYATRDPTRIVEFLFWPMIDIGFFGLTARWISSVAAEPTVVQLFITALVLWQLVYRSNFEICVNLMDEFLEKNMINIVASPLRKKEWILAMMLSGLLKMSFTFLLALESAGCFFGSMFWS